MERFRCKFCFKDFANGRALGGHMRSHMLNFDKDFEEDEEEEWPSQLSEETESASSSTDEEEEEEGNVGLLNGSRRFPGSVVLLDREGQTESTRNLTQQRFKRVAEPGESGNLYNNREEDVKRLRLSQLDRRTESWVEAEPLSSVSETTTEEDVAFCLMMLSRDNGSKKKKKKMIYEDEETDESEEFKSSNNKKRGNYKCETCNKVFKSYQALGGHRTSHKKNRVLKTEHKIEIGNLEKKIRIHECPVCFRVFSSGQALGGHKRSHGITGLTENSGLKNRLEQRFIDLNLPAPIEHDHLGQIEVSFII